MVEEFINSRFQDVDWSSQPDIDRAFTDIPFGVYDSWSPIAYEHGHNTDVDHYEDVDFDLRGFLEAHKLALSDDGLGLVCHSPQQTEAVVETARSLGINADYSNSIVLYFQNEGHDAAPPLYTNRKLAQNRYEVTLLEMEEHEFNYEYVYNAIPYPRETRDIEWHPCPFHLEPLRYLMMKFGGDAWIDFCAGTGTVGKVAKEQDKGFVLVEEKEEYFDNMVEYVKKSDRDALSW